MSSHTYECLSTATALVLINGSPTEEFSLSSSRGLRQGDYIISFPILIAADPQLVRICLEGMRWVVTGDQIEISNSMKRKYNFPFNIFCIL